MKGYCDNIEKLTLANANFRQVLYTGAHLQLVLMTLQPGEEIVSGPYRAVSRLLKNGAKIILEGAGQ